MIVYNSSLIVSTMWEYSQQKLGFQTLSMFNGSSKVLALAVPLDFVYVRSITRSRAHQCLHDAQLQDLRNCATDYQRQKIQAIRDLQFGGLLNLNCTEVRHNLSTDVGLIFGLPTEGRNLQVTSTSSDHPFRTIRACEEKLLDLPVGEEFRRAFIYYACATLLAPTSRLNGCRVPEISTLERTMEPETNVDHDTNVDAENSDEIWHQYHDAERTIDQYQRGIQQQLRIMRGIMHNQHSHSDDHAFPGDEYMASHAAYHVLDTPDRVVAPEYELQPSVPINVVSDGEEQPEGNVVPTNRNVRRRRVRRMAPNLLSPYISQPQTKQSAIKNRPKIRSCTGIWRRFGCKASPTMRNLILSVSNMQEMIDIPYVNVNESIGAGLLTGSHKEPLDIVCQGCPVVAAHKKEVSPYDLRTFNFITPDVPLQTNEHDCGVFVMKFMELWSMGGFSKSIDVVEDHGEYVVLSTKCTPRPCPERLKGINLIVFLLKLLVNALCIYGHPMNWSRWTRGSESKCSTGRYCPSAIGQPVEPFFSRSRTPYWMRESAFWHPRPEIDRSIIRSTGSWRFGQATG
ncbi:hypothetical protein CK203_034726 [Vitis vinifera]|uniref:Ubiquitin-like protease family profile domain-containing protein n=1 Tax=Vitis vinifera TaxID=29760 RepID=A0A438HWF7_VITVI|nr:hypothetical protein CK203_034726 [Vitis vinifera]